MAGDFVGASTQYLTANSSITAFPFSIGVWFNLRAVGTVVRTLVALSDTGTTNNYVRIRMGTTEVMGIGATAGGTESAQESSTILVVNTWNFAIARFISSTNRRLSVLHSTGEITNIQGTAARATAGIDTLTVGALQTSAGVSTPWDGLVGEVWLTNTDIQPDGGQLDGALLSQLAYGGPFSVPHIAQNIVEYHSFRKGLSSDTFDNEEDFLSGIGVGEVLTNTNGVTVGHHPPLPYWYERPGQRRRVLII